MQTSDRSNSLSFRFRRIGPVADAQLELGDLTLIAGRNNTGKTYIVYTLYGFLKLWNRWPAADELESLRRSKPEAGFPDVRSLAKEVLRDGEAAVRVEPMVLDRQRKYLLAALTRSFSKEILPQVFSSHEGDFARSRIDVLLRGPTHNPSPELRTPLPDGGVLSVGYDGKEIAVSAEDLKADRRWVDLDWYLGFCYVMFLLRQPFPLPFILSAERFGISLFYRELDFTKNQLVDILQKLGDDKSRERVSPYLLLDRATSRYALPIKDNIDFTRSIPDLRGKKSDFVEEKLFDHIKNMMAGRYGNAGDDIRFISKARGEGRSFNIPLHLASSSARGLSDLYFFLRHVARRGQLLIVDEPESHLDTANQIRFARLLTRAIHSGLKVLVTTHSDYFVKEINNLIMLSSPAVADSSIPRRLKYGPEERLQPSAVRAYVAEKSGLTQCVVDRFGVNMPMFDRTIDSINRVSNELASRLAQESED